MLSVEMYPSLTLGPQRLGDCFYRERDAPTHVPLFPPACDVPAQPLLLAPPPAPNDAAAKGREPVKMELENSALWKQFSTVGTEMIITKKGRRMFPGLRLKLSGLNPSLRYIILLDIVPVDNSRYRFQGGAWQAVGGAEARLPDRVFIHPDSPATGAHWQSRTISFHYAKLTNNTLDTRGHIILHSLHRYQPRVHVIEARDVLRWGGGQHSFVFPETQFITVTAYQNNKITELKINSNPFAKGFRDDGMNSKKQRDARQKRKIADVTETLDIESCDPCDPADTDLQALALASLPPLPDPSCGYRPEEAAYQGALVPEPPLDLDQVFMTSQMPDIAMTIASEMQDVAVGDVANNLLERSAAYTSSYPSSQAASSSFPSAPLPQPSPFSSLPVPDSSNPSAPPPSSEVQPSSAPPYPSMPLPPIDYPHILASSPMLSSSSSSTSPLLQQTTFTYPTLTPPPSNSSSPQPLLSPPGTYHAIPPTNQELLSPHTPIQTAFPPSCQDPMSLLGQPISSGNNSPTDQSSAVFTYPHLPPGNPNPDPVTVQPLPNLPSNLGAPGLPCSFPAHGAAASFFPPMQNLSFPNVPPAQAHHPALHLPNLSQAQAPPLSSAFPPSSFTHPSFQTSSCLGVPQAPSMPPPPHSQNLTPASSSYPADIGAIPQYNPPAPYLSEMVLHHQPPSLPSCLQSSVAPPALYPAFPSYPLRLCQDPRSSLSIPLRHLYDSTSMATPTHRGPTWI
ncbi:LOW QUALITY PROTEIN: T-box transcription factor TBX6 [Genypterus blacodes]|uniref:LOW QUALITY PROTEIN: T-box transcription factor TBX6 n=1 Tax=Genypterus blacodes TaxID=154954 RepID=UPI003F75B68C